MAPKNRYLPSLFTVATKSVELKLRRSTRRFMKREFRRSRVELQAVIREEFSKFRKESNKPQKNVVNRLREKLARKKTPHCANPTISRLVDQDNYEIIITPSLNKPIYTGSKIEGENGEQIKVTLYKNGEKETSEPLASAEVEILTVYGYFCEKGETDWTYEEFDSNIVKERDGVGLFLASSPVLKLVNGEATLDGLCFKDNSSWVRNKMFRIGARILSNYNVRVKEGITEPFRVKDRHGRASEKPNIPKLKDGVKCLKGVGKQRASDLKKNKICKVKDFLRLSFMDESRLLEILEIKSNKHESWKAMIKHAKMCKVGSRLYSYQVDNVIVFFTSVYELVGAEIDGHYKDIYNLAVSKKVHRWKKKFYKAAGGLQLDFKMGKNGPIPLENDTSEVSLSQRLCSDLETKDNDQIVTVHDGNSLDNICSTSKACSDKTIDAREDIPSNSYTGGSCISNQVNNFGDQDMIRWEDLALCDENQVDSPESNHNNPRENEYLLIESDFNDVDWSEIWPLLGDLPEADMLTVSDEPTNKKRVRLRDIVTAVCWTRWLLHYVHHKKSGFVSQNGKSTVSD